MRCYNKRRARASYCEDCGKELKRKNNVRCMACHKEHVHEMASTRQLRKEKRAVGCWVDEKLYTEIRGSVYKLGYTTLAELIRDGIERVLRDKRA